MRHLAQQEISNRLFKLLKIHLSYLKVTIQVLLADLIQWLMEPE